MELIILLSVLRGCYSIYRPGLVLERGSPSVGEGLLLGTLV